MHKIFQVRREQRKLALLSGADFNSSGRQIKRFAFPLFCEDLLLSILLSLQPLKNVDSVKCSENNRPSTKISLSHFLLLFFFFFEPLNLTELDKSRPLISS